MRSNLSLALFGGFLGALLIGVIYFTTPTTFGYIAFGSGSKFNSLDELRRAMEERDSRDSLPNGEVSLRSIVRPNPSDKIIYELQPNITAQFRHVPVTINQFGFRERDISLRKPPNTYRIAVLGDSYTFGWGVNQDQVFTRKMEDELKKTAPKGINVQVLNFGVPGYATFQEVAQFIETGIKFEPDAVLVYFINNDFGLPFFIKDLDNSNSLQSAPQFSQSRIKPEESEKFRKKKELLESLDANRALLSLAHFCKDKQIPVFLAVHPDKTAKKMKKKLWVLKNKPGKDLIDLLWFVKQFDETVKLENIPENALVVPHDHHPGPGAHKVIGEILAKRLGSKIWGPKDLHST